jgi:hypothetical protein
MFSHKIDEVSGFFLLFLTADDSLFHPEP